jgi:hypothetical protein
LLIRGLGTGLLAVGLFAVSCSESPGGSGTVTAHPVASSTESLDRVELNDEPVNLPQTTLVTCQAVAANEYLFSWMGSNILVPRRPFDERSSTVTLRFTVAPPAVTTASMQLYFRGRLLQLQSPSDLGQGDPKTVALTPTGEYKYTLAGTFTEPNSETPWYYVHIEFHC